jgi:hypothetical protein
MDKKTVIWVDPPSGWRYGFPKPRPADLDIDLHAWLVSEGYPQAEIDACGDYFFVRSWTEPAE